jgi:hypothetical protein
MKTILWSTLLSLGLFFSISFTSILLQLHPFHERESNTLFIGFPFTYYEEFQLGGHDGPNFGWYFPSLFYNALFCWLFSLGIYVLVVKNYKRIRVKTK